MFNDWFYFFFRVIRMVRTLLLSAVLLCNERWRSKMEKFAWKFFLPLMLSLDALRVQIST